MNGPVALIDKHVHTKAIQKKHTYCDSKPEATNNKRDRGEALGARANPSVGSSAQFHIKRVLYTGMRHNK